MAILTTVLQTVNGVQGGLNGNMAIQTLGSVPIDFGSTNPVTAYSPLVNSNAHIIVTDGYVRMPNGPPAPTANGYPLQVSIRIAGIQVMVINLNPQGLELSVPMYSWGDLQGTPPLGAGNVITAAMLVPSAVSKMGFVDVIGYGASAS